VKRDRTIFMLGWDQYGLEKKHTGTRYVELVFLHSVGTTGHVVHSVASGAPNVDGNPLGFESRSFGGDER
jgi:hypothetical protein